MRRLSALALLAVAACSSDDAPTRPEIVSFTASELFVEPGAKTTLSWNVARVGRLSIAPQGLPNLLSDSPKPEGTVETNPIDDHTVFVLRATGADGRAIGASVLVRVNFPPPVIDEFSIAPDDIQAGERTLLRWATTNADAVMIVDGDGAPIVEDGAPDDTTPTKPAATQRYTLTAIGKGGSVTATADVTVRGTAPAVVRFEARPPSIFEGESTSLEWEVLEASAVRIVDGGGNAVFDGPDLTGAAEVTPSDDTDYVLVATNADGSATSSVTVTVRAPSQPTITRFEASPNPAGIGDTVTLDFAASDARRIAITAGGIEIFSQVNGPGIGTTDVVLTSTQTAYTLLATNAFGSATRRLDVYGHVMPTIERFEATPTLFSGSTSVDLVYRAADVSQLRLFANGAAVPSFPVVDRDTTTIGASDSLTITATVTTSYELVAASGAGERRAYVTVVDGVAEIEPNDTPGIAMLLGGRDVAASLSTASDVDVYAVDVPAGGAVYAETNDGPTHCAADTQLTLLDTDGVTPLVFDDDDGLDACSRIDPAVDALAAALPMGRYYLAVDSGSTSGGTYVLSVFVSGPSCGDGALESGEQCDDGNTTPGDGCDASCAFEHGPAVPASASPTTVSVTLPSASSIAVIAVDLDRPGQALAARAAEAGDTCAVVDTAVELHDDAGFLGAASGGGPTGAAGTCGAIRYPADTFALNRPATRHYVVVRSENGAAGPIDVTITVRNPSCGNGVLESLASEQCDDNNQTNGDGCDDTCRLESGLFPEIEPNDTQPAANDSGLAGIGVVTLQGANDPAGDDDVFRFTVPANQSLRLSARTYSAAGQPMSCDSATTDTRIFLEAAGSPSTVPGTSELAFNDDIDNANNVWCSALTDVVVTGGPTGSTYYLRVQGWLDMGRTDYFVDLRLDP